jgi:hypothetical protein
VLSLEVSALATAPVVEMLPSAISVTALLSAIFTVIAPVGVFTYAGADSVTVSAAVSHVQLIVFDAVFPFDATSWIVFVAIEHENRASVDGVNVKL